MMIKVEAIVREEVFDDVKQALNDIKVNGIPFWGSDAYFDLESPGDREMYSRIQLTKIISQNQAQKDSEST